MTIVKNVFLFLANSKNRGLLVLLSLFILSFLLFRQCESTKKAKNETIRTLNNWKASQDTIRNFKDKYGNSVAEVRALTLTLDEIRDSLEFEKNRPPITIIEYNTQIVEKIVEVPVYIKDTNIGDFKTAIVINESDSWGNSSREIKINVPFSISNDSLSLGKALIGLKQNIFLTASIVRDNKTKEVFVNLLSDYPGTTFNNANGILIDMTDDGFKNLEFQSRKSLGLGFQLGVGVSGNGIVPYVGVGINYTPKFFQW